jgi:LacI family fructose operon transcriptional repressor
MTIRRARAVTRLLERGVDGVVIAPCSPRIALPPSGGRRSCAVVMTDRAFPSQPYRVVVTDNEAAGRRRADILLAERGDAVFLAASRWLPSIEERIRGFLSTCGEYGLDDAEARVFSSESDDVAAGRQLMEEAIAKRGGLPGALVCSSLLVFEGVRSPERTVAAGPSVGHLRPPSIAGVPAQPGCLRQAGREGDRQNDLPLPDRPVEEQAGSCRAPERLFGNSTPAAV